MRGRILQNEKLDCTKRLEYFRASWAQTGCTVMSDGWTDQKGRTLIKFLVSCPKETMFIKSVDASAQIKDARTLCDLLDVFILELDEKIQKQQRVSVPRHYTVCHQFHISSIPLEFYVGCEENVSFRGVTCFANEPQTRGRGRMQTSFIPERLMGGSAVTEVYAVTEPLVKVLQLVDGEKSAVGYLYEVMDRAKEAIRTYYDDKGDEGF
eukprot:PITA_32330